MAVAFRSAGASAANSASGNITPAMPSGFVADDILILLVETANQAVTTPDGWTALDLNPINATSTTLRIYWLRATGSEAAPTITGAADHTIGQILAFSGCVTSGNPFDSDRQSTVLTSASTSVTFPSTTTVANALVLLILSTSSDTLSQNVSAYSNATLGSITEHSDSSTNLGNGGGISCASATLSAAGATGTTTATLSATGAQARVTVALMPQTATVFTLVVSPASFAITGQSVGAVAGRNVAVAVLAMVGEGQSVELVASRIVTVAPLAMVVSGQSQALNAARLIAVNPLEISITGHSQILQAGRTIAVTSLPMAITGQEQSLTAARSLTVDPTSFAIAGQDATMTIGRRLVAARLAIVIDPEIVGLVAARVFHVDPLSIEITGQIVTMTVAGPVIAAAAQPETRAAASAPQRRTA